MAVQAYVNKFGTPPTKTIFEVEIFQKAEKTLKVDGLWGPNVKAAAAWYLSDNKLPGYAAAFNSTKLTWVPPTVIKTKTVATIAKPLISVAVTKAVDPLAIQQKAVGSSVAGPDKVITDGGLTRDDKGRVFFEVDSPTIVNTTPKLDPLPVVKTAPVQTMAPIPTPAPIISAPTPVVPSPIIELLPAKKFEWGTAILAAGVGLWVIHYASKK